jgi:hypothetical protein
MSAFQTTLLAVAETPPPAGGAALKEVIIATIMGGIAFGGVVLLALGHRSGKISWLQTAGDFAARRSGLPYWAALPLGLLTFSLITAVFGLYWDISLHLYNGRDEGPLANPSHYAILVGLLGCFSAGVFALTMPKPGTRPSPWSVRLAEGWYAPVGAILIAVSAAFGLIGFPLDDFWHRMFGQDVTLWGPTHLLMLSGAGLCVVGASVLLTEGRLAAKRVRGEARESAYERAQTKVSRIMAAGGLLVALSIYQGEFDYGIAQFQMVFHPIMIMAAAGVALTYARITAGKGGAIGAVLFFWLIRGALTVIVHYGFGKSLATFPLFMGSAFAVELVGLLMATQIKTKPIQFGLAAGAAIGVLGLATEWWWSQVWTTYEWTSALLPEGLIVGFVCALGAGAIGAWMANSLMLRARPTGSWRWAPIVGFFAIAVCAGYGLHQYTPSGVTATMTNTVVDTGKAGTWVKTTVKLNTDRFDSDQKWARSISWQGPGFQVDELKKIGPGLYQTTVAVPAFGKWKSMVRFHSGNTMMGAPIFEPYDAAIEGERGKEVPASPQVTRELQADRVVLQREAKFEGGWLAMTGYLIMLAIAMLLLAMLAWGIYRISDPLTDEQKSGEGFDEPRFTSAHSGGPQPTATPSTT